MIDGILDTNIIIDMLHQLPSAINWHSQQTPTKRLSITPIVWLEAVEGARNRLEQRRIINFLSGFHIEHFSVTDTQWAILQFGRFHLSHGIDYEDVLIASVAARLQIPLYTANLKHMAVLPSVTVIKPY